MAHLCIGVVHCQIQRIQDDGTVHRYGSRLFGSLAAAGKEKRENEENRIETRHKIPFVFDPPVRAEDLSYHPKRPIDPERGIMAP